MKEICLSNWLIFIGVMLFSLLKSSSSLTQPRLLFRYVGGGRLQLSRSISSEPLHSLVINNIRTDNMMETLGEKLGSKLETGDVVLFTGMHVRSLLLSGALLNRLACIR